MSDTIAKEINFGAISPTDGDTKLEINAPEKKEYNELNDQSDTEIGPDGFAQKKGAKTKINQPAAPQVPIEHNKANSTKIKQLNRFNTAPIVVGFFTKTAIKLMESQVKRKGNNTIHTMGLNTFDKKIRTINNAIRDDNPIADSLLFDIERLMEMAHNEISVLISGLQQKTERFFVSHHAGISYDQEYAYSYEASWTNKISNKIMWLIKDADIYFNQVNLASKAAIITDQTANNLRHQVRNKLLNIMHYVNRYKHSKITRSDIAYKTALAVSVLESEGKDIMLYSDVLMLIKRAETAPRISIRPTNKIGEIREQLEPIYNTLKKIEDQAIHNTVPKSVKEAF